MGIFKKTFRMIFKKNNGSEKKHNNTLEEDIHSASDWVVKALNSSGYKADYSLENLLSNYMVENGILMIATHRERYIFLSS